MYMPVLFFLFWIVLNGRITVEIAVFGLVISCAIYLVERWLDKENSTSRHPISLFGYGIIYILALLWEILKATWTMIVEIMTKRGDVPSAIVSFDAPVRTNFAQVVLANSITMTPGTISVELEDGHYRVHCYEKELADGITESRLVRILQKAEEKL